MLQVIWNSVFWAGSSATGNPHGVQERTSERADEERNVTSFEEDTWSPMTYIWNNGILSGGKESAVSRNLQADK